MILYRAVATDVIVEGEGPLYYAELPVMRETTHHWFVADEGKIRRVKKIATKHYACPTKELALLSFIYRKRKWLMHTKRRVEQVLTALEWAENANATIDPEGP